MTREQIIKDLETVFQMAVAKNAYAIALRSKEAQSKILGLLKEQDTETPAFSLKNLNTQELEFFLKEIEQEIQVLSPKKNRKNKD